LKIKRKMKVNNCVDGNFFSINKSNTLDSLSDSQSPGLRILSSTLHFLSLSISKIITTKYNLR
jgi:hypothetical protein